MRFFPLVLALVSLIAAPASADLTQVPSGSSVKIDRHGVCWNVKNDNSSAVMVPHLTPQEWSVGLTAFLAASRPGITLSSCGRSTPTLVSSGAVVCPGSADFRSCGLETGTKSDGSRLLVLQSNSLGREQGGYGLHLYDSANAGVPTLIGSTYNVPPRRDRTLYAWMTASSDMSRVAFIGRHSNGTSNTGVEIFVYSMGGVAGATPTLIYRVAVENGNYAGRPGISPTGDHVAGVGRIYSSSGATYSQVFDTGVRPVSEAHAVWSEAIGGFLMNAITEVRVVKRASDGTWSVTQTLKESDATGKTIPYMTASADGKTFSISRSDKKIIIYKFDGTSFQRYAELTGLLGSNSWVPKTAISSDGRYFLVGSPFGGNYIYSRNVLQYDLSGATPVRVADIPVAGDPHESAAGTIAVSDIVWPSPNYRGRVHFLPAPK